MAHQRISESGWREHISRWRSSGLSAQAYAEQSNIARERLVHWARRLDRETPVVPLLPVIVNRPDTAGRIELRSPSGWTISLGAQAAPLWLTNLLTELP